MFTKILCETTAGNNVGSFQKRIIISKNDFTRILYYRENRSAKLAEPVFYLVMNLCVCCKNQTCSPHILKPKKKKQMKAGKKPQKKFQQKNSFKNFSVH